MLVGEREKLCGRKEEKRKNYNCIGIAISLFFHTHQ
jgi:hypothetical protein